MADGKVRISDLKEKVRHFIAVRDWKQFHSAKNLTMSVAIEAAELMEIFQWKEAESPAELDKREKTLLRNEIADVFIYLLDLCDLFEVDLSDAVAEKMEQNEKKYPAARVRGKSHKYTYYMGKT